MITATVTDEHIQEMLQAIPDQDTREHYERIVNGVISHELRCNSKLCKGRVIAHLYVDGQWVGDVEEKIVKKGTPIKGTFPVYSRLETYRIRFDGQTGFKCGCGNSSILAAAEDGVISGTPPSKNDLRKIYGNMQEKPGDYAEAADGSITVDGFTINPVKGQN